ncbi:MAG: hypothetical protein KGD57_07135 [Candidatus Lokiarchaeota archaeon]|nr:hypothetical protein [Candidatus Lokiarchaeota archaeon]
MNYKVISLLSDGFDSPIASYLMIKQDIIPIFLSFITTEPEKEDMRAKIIKIVKKLSTYSKEKLKIYFVQHYPNLELIKRICIRKLTCVLCKRLMIRIAMKIGNIEGTNLILTGDILGEQASQTLDNLFSYNDLFINCIKLAPLIGFNKLDIMKISKKIGLYEICSQKFQSCLYFPEYPETRAKMDEIRIAENNITIDEWISNVLDNVEVLKF